MYIYIYIICTSPGVTKGWRRRTVEEERNSKRYLGNEPSQVAKTVVKIVSKVVEIVVK